MGLEIVPITFAEASEFVARHHRHHKPPVGQKFSVAVSDGARGIIGVAMVGRPVARRLDDGWTVEVNRVATDGTKNACSKLYGACRKIAFAMGYRRIVTYTLSEEPGTSLRAAGWRLEERSPGGSWSCKSRPRVDLHPLQEKIRWGCERGRGAHLDSPPVPTSPGSDPSVRTPTGRDRSQDSEREDPRGSRKEGQG